MHRTFVARLSSALAILLFAVVAGAEIPEIRFERLTVEEGLSANGVWTILQDRRGFLWFGTDEGLNRWDGYRVSVFRHDPKDPESISGSEVITLYEDRSGDLWVGTSSGLNRFRRDQESFERFRHDPGDPTTLSHELVLRIFEDRRGDLWLGTPEGLNRLDRESGTFSRFYHDPEDPTTLSSHRISAIYEDRDGVLWVGSDGGLDRLDPATGIAIRHGAGGESGLRVTRILDDARGGLWLGSSAGLRRFDPASGAFDRLAVVPPVMVLDLYRDPAGRLWLGTHFDGLVVFDPRTGASVTLRHDSDDPQSLPSDGVFAITPDRTGLIWVGTVDGVGLYDPRRAAFKVLRRRPGGGGLSDDRIWAVLVDRRDELWVGTYSRGLDRLGAGRRIVARYRHDSGDPSSLPGDVVSALHEDRRGELWVGTLTGLARFDRERDRFIPHPPAMSDSRERDPRVLSLAEDVAGRLWVGSGRGLCWIDQEGRTIRPFTGGPEIDSRLPWGMIPALVADGGELWIGAREGLFRLDPTAPRLEVFRHRADDPKSLSNDHVLALHHDQRGDLWIGTQDGGLDRLDPASGEFERFDRWDGLPAASVFGILEDPRGHLWLATSRGLVRFDPSRRRFQTYDTGDGLTTLVFSHSSAFAGTDGRLYFGSTRGLHVFDPAALTDDPHPPPVAITGLRLFDQPVGPRQADARSPLARSILETEEIVLSHHDYVFSFEFAALHFASPASNRYAHRLEGFDPEWIETGADRRTAHYSNLRPGSYTFRVKAANDDGVWNEEGAALRVIVRPPPWKTWWAFLLYTAAAVAAVWRFVAAGRRELERERTVSRKLREVAELKDDLLSQTRSMVEERTAQVTEREGLIRELERKNAELERFNYTVSHDLKTPLVTIKGFLGLAGRDAASGDGDRLAHDLTQIAAAADQMHQLLEELLEFSRVGQMIQPSAGVDLGEVARQAIELVRGRLDARGGEVTVAPDLPVVFGDRLRLLEVFQNLLDNAAKFVADTEPPRIEIGTRSADDDAEVVIYVRDHGTGIDPRYHDKIFGLFERLDAAVEGTGIGLALVRRIIELHGGRIWVESEGGSGSTFYFTLLVRGTSKPMTPA